MATIQDMQRRFNQSRTRRPPPPSPPPPKRTGPVQRRFSPTSRAPASTPDPRTLAGRSTNRNAAQERVDSRRFGRDSIISGQRSSVVAERREQRAFQPPSYDRADPQILEQTFGREQAAAIVGIDIPEQKGYAYWRDRGRSLEAIGEIYGNIEAYAEWEKFKEENRPGTAFAKEEISDFFTGLGDALKDPQAAGNIGQVDTFSPEVMKGFPGTALPDSGTGALTASTVAGQTRGGWVINEQGDVVFDPGFRSSSNQVIGQGLVWNAELGTYQQTGIEITKAIAAGSARSSGQAIDYATDIDQITGLRVITDRSLMPNVMSDFVMEQMAPIFTEGGDKEDFATWAGYEETAPGVWRIKDPVDTGNYGYGSYGGYRGGGYGGYQSPSYGYGPNSYTQAYNWRIRIT